MAQESPKQNHSTSHRSEALSKFVPTRVKTEPDQRDFAQSRTPLRNALPSSKTAGKAKHGHSVRQAAKDTVQSALELRPPITFEHLLRRDRRTPAHSRRNSTDGTPPKPQERLEPAQQETRALRKQIGIDDVNRIVEQNKRRELELKRALEQVEEQGTKYTRQLDDTYYGLLERGEALRNVVRNLQSLAEDSRSLRSRFDSEATELQRTADQDIDGYNNFDDQEQTIRGLLSRLDSSRQRTASLNARLDTARKRVEASEQRVLTAQVQRRKRWQVVWAVMATILGIALGFWIARKNAELNARIQKGGVLMPEKDEPSTRLFSLPMPSQDSRLQELFEGIS